MNFADTYIRGGIYPPTALPIRLGGEASGVVVKLPTDEAVLKDPDYVKRNLQEGGRVVVVSAISLYKTY